jgi:hypothetical protein
MKLTKRIPAHTMTAQFNWCKKDFMEIGPKYREIRSGFSDPMDACFWCGHKFADGEMMALAQLKGKRNKILCQGCANQL